MDLSGRSYIGNSRGAGSGERFRAVNPATGAEMEPVFYEASDAEVSRACELANQAFAKFSRVSAKERAKFLRAIAAEIEKIGEALVERASAETALPPDRIRSERGRTCNQLKLFADVIEEGSWVDARIDQPDPERKPIPKPDVRSMLRPLGPVAVFGASNFPLAFSVAGGDTASALAAGNPVVVKAHPAHPGTSELVAGAILRAAQACGMPEGVFSLVFGLVKAGTTLVQHPAIQAGGFTGSRVGGLALAKLAQNRPQPIPFYAEMSSVNPVFILPGALRERGEQLAKGLYGSFTLGAGQFCTKPGLIFVERGADTDRLAKEIGAQTGGSNSFTLLTKAIHSSYRSGVDERTRLIGRSTCGPAAAGAGLQAAAAVFESDAESFFADPSLGAELFGPSSLIVRYNNREQLIRAAEEMEGQLTATVHATKEDLAEYQDLIGVLEKRVGRIVLNGYPTGVEVGHAMVHGGPFPSTSDSRTTSVGTRAIFRFARPVCYQNFPSASLPEELQDANPLGIWRMIDGKLTREPVRQPVASR